MSPIILKNLPDHGNDRCICLTFDDGPDPRYTGLILDVLAAYKMHANFFVLGESAELFPQLIERMVVEGHVVGNHTYSHRHPWLISSNRAQQEVTKASGIINKLTGYWPRWFRPPHGRLRTAMLNQAQAEGMKTVLWSRSAIDWGPKGTDVGVAQRLCDIKCGDIVLMHDGARRHNRPEITIKQLPRAIELLLDKGITAVTLDQIWDTTAG